jgi:hypothetical protein
MSSWFLEAVNQRIDNIMVKRTNNDLQNPAQKTKDRAMRTQIKPVYVLICS